MTKRNNEQNVHYVHKVLSRLNIFSLYTYRNASLAYCDMLFYGFYGQSRGKINQEIFYISVHMPALTKFSFEYHYFSRVSILTCSSINISGENCFVTYSLTLSLWHGFFEVYFFLKVKIMLYTVTTIPKRENVHAKFLLI